MDFVYLELSNSTTEMGWLDIIVFLATCFVLREIGADCHMGLVVEIL